MPFKRYARYLLIGVLLIVVFACMFNWLVDPYSVFGTPRYEGLNKEKPYAGNRGRIAKLYQVQRVHPGGLIVGNSRPEMGLDPNHQCWPKSARPVYNISLPGLSVFSQVRYAQHAMASGPVSMIIIGIDFLDFLYRIDDMRDPRKWPPKRGFSEAFLVDYNQIPAPSHRWKQIRDYVSATLSLKTLGHSILTAIRQKNSSIPTRTRKGFNLGERYYRPIIRAEGIRVLFAQKNREIMTRLNSKKWSLYQGSEKWSAAFEALVHLIQDARNRGSSVTLFINPYHAEYLSAIALSGLWSAFEEWKLQLTNISKAQKISLWDFSGFDKFSRESVESVADKGASLSWFWEPAHYKKALGDILMANILRPHCPMTHKAERYGVQLNNANVKDHLMITRALKDQFIKKNKSLVIRLQRAIVR